MAHLSARHGDARRRRDELVRERSLVIATKTGYPFNFQTSKPANSSAKTSSASAAAASTAASGGFECVDDNKRYTAEELAGASRRCQDRIHSAREKEVHARRLESQREQERQQRSDAAGLEAPGLAAKRLRDHKRKKQQLHEASLNTLIKQQPSSIEAMNIARMLSSRFEERVVFTPLVTKRSVEDERVTALLESSRVGSYYQ